MDENQELIRLKQQQPAEIFYATPPLTLLTTSFSKESVVPSASQIMVEPSQLLLWSSNSADPMCQIHFMLESRLSEPEPCTTAMCRDPGWSLASSRGHDPGTAGRWLANRTKYYMLVATMGKKNQNNILYTVQSSKLTNNAILFNLPKTNLKLRHRVKTIFQKILKPVFLSLNFLKV